MAQVNVTVNGRTYSIACDDGQESHVGRLGRYLEQKVAAIVKNVGQVGDQRLLVMAALTIADELVDTDQALTQAREEAGAPTREQVRAQNMAIPGLSLPAAVDEAALAGVIDSLAMRIEGIAASLEQD